MQAKIRELYKASQESQAAAAMMGGGGQPINPYPGSLNGHKYRIGIPYNLQLNLLHFNIKYLHYFKALTTQH